MRFQRGKCTGRSPATAAHRAGPLLVHLVAGHAGGEAVQHARPLVEGADDAVADAEVVVDEVELGLAARREVDPVGVGHPHHLVVDLELDGDGLLDAMEKT